MRWLILSILAFVISSAHGEVIYVDGVKITVTEEPVDPGYEYGDDNWLRRDGTKTTYTVTSMPGAVDYVIATVTTHEYGTHLGGTPFDNTWSTTKQIAYGASLSIQNYTQESQSGENRDSETWAETVTFVAHVYRIPLNTSAKPLWSNGTTTPSFQWATLGEAVPITATAAATNFFVRWQKDDGTKVAGRENPNTTYTVTDADFAAQHVDLEAVFHECTGLILRSRSGGRILVSRDGEIVRDGDPD